MEDREMIQEALKTDTEKKNISLLGGKINLTRKQFELCKIFIPVAFIVLCAIVAWIMLGSALESGNNIDGRFEFLQGNETNYIEMDSDGEYTKVSGEETQKGSWSISGTDMTFESGGKTIKGKFVDRKYIVLKDENFLSGNVESGEKIEAEVTASDGTVYGLDPEGKFYSKVDGAYMEIGSYIADGNFIIVTTAEGNITYLNCGDGITSVFYQAV